MTKDERMNALENAGIDIHNMFSLRFDERLKPGARIDVFVTNGNEDDVEARIKNDGYVNNPHLYRRWICAQMFRIVYRMENYNLNFTDYMKKNYPWHYQLSMMENELKVLAKMEKEHDPQFEIRSKFFSIENVKKIYGELADEFCNNTMSVFEKNGYGFEYSNAIYNSYGVGVYYLQIKNCNTYPEILEYVRLINTEFRKAEKVVGKLDFNKTWLDCYKGAGAYYTLQNLVLFHDVFILNKYGSKLYGEGAYAYLNAKASEYKNEGWKLFGFMKGVLEYNHFNISDLY